MNRESLRDAYGTALVESGREHSSVVVLDADLSKSTRTTLFEKEFPDRFFEMGIAEQNMISTAAGLSIAGKIPFVNTFAVFAAGRGYDQIRQSICIPRLNVKICGSSAGLSDYGDGSTHQAIDDIAIMRALPNMMVLAPSDSVETALMVNEMVRYDGPVYMRISRSLLPVYTEANEDYSIHTPSLLREGRDIIIFANGSMIEKAFDAAEMLADKGISLRIVNVSKIKPMDRQALIPFVKNMKGIITAEEHSLIGGMGAAVLYALRNDINMPVKMIGVNDRFGTSSDNVEELMYEYGLTKEVIINAAEEITA